VLDREARALVALRDRSLPPLARTAGAFVARQCWSVLGYSRLGDCARERLGRSGRWVRDLAALDHALSSHPALARAVRGADGGAPLRRVAALVIARVAEAKTIDRWIEAGRALTVRRLKVAAARARQGQDPFEDGAGAASSVDAARATQPRSAPRADRPGQLDADGPGDDAEEGELGAGVRSEVGADSVERVRVRLAVPRAVAVAFDEAFDLFRAISGGEAPLAEFVDALAAEHLAAGRPDDVELWPVGEMIRDSQLERAMEVAGGEWGGLEHGPVEVEGDESWQHTVAALAAEADRGDAGDLLARLCEWIRLEDEVDRRLGRVLARLGSCGAWHELRFTGPGHYARERLGMGRSTAEDRVWLARWLADYPLLRSAYEEGRLGVESTLLVRRILSSGRVDAEVEQAWVDHAEQVTVRRLRDEARPYRYSPVVPRASGSSGPSAGRKLDLPPTDAAWYASLERGPGRSRDRLARLTQGLEVLEAPDVFLAFRLPQDVAESLRLAIGSATAQLEGEVAAGYTRTAPSQLVARTFSTERRRVPSWVGLLALLEEFVAVWDPPGDLARSRKADAVYRRAGWRCEVPGCTSRSNLEDHHLRYRSHGGGNALRNRNCMCRGHHQRGQHGGLLSCSGTAPLGVTWRLGAPRFATWYRNDRRLEVKR